LEKHITKWSYIFGVIALGIAVILRAVDVVDPNISEFSTRGSGIGYKAFMDGAILFFIATIASTCSSWSKAQRTHAAFIENRKEQRERIQVEMMTELANGRAAHENAE
jgi:hypothetical protein